MESQEKRYSLRLNPKEVHLLEVLKTVTMKTTTSGVIVEVITNYHALLKKLKQQKAEIEELQAENHRLKTAATKFTEACEVFASVRNDA